MAFVKQRLKQMPPRVGRMISALVVLSGAMMIYAAIGLALVHRVI
ncbi:hypothetical protein TM5383_02186 [Thalassovita mediterranea]|jgi:hypothetical protein|uniref:Uncharacterized protein n=1 Tax=Thalassovita mediterranea TaxID=340021 RepID=A0A0P1H3J4_9RHOB|nr:hypothetical protein TM5383_02186 [Thalassovita mediterranea]SIS28921.1 hypothetical protein SAMN05421685_101734 [Thalassovita mediterranea]